MKIAFFTEMPFSGKLPRLHPNARTEFAWMIALNADHHNINQYFTKETYDLGIVIIPKKQPNIDINKYRDCCKKVAVMQEGPHWFFQDYSMNDQITYYNNLTAADIIFAHNYKDRNYYVGLTGHMNVHVMKSLMIEDTLEHLQEEKRSGVIIGGNFCSWYGGFDSYIVASSQFQDVYAPSMGRKIDNENHLVKHLPYMEWSYWIHELNKFKIGVHLMRTQAAGTFALNCGFLGLPCIGYKGLDTQEFLHPLTTVGLGDLAGAKDLIKELNNDKNFYEECSKLAKNRYQGFYHESVFLKDFNNLKI